ncbi:MAG TPA: hypothetical protein DCY40_04570 [Actinobacteria bacterium]|nr:hypothetical protein [Actinomycetota bacterium]
MSPSSSTDRDASTPAQGLPIEPPQRSFVGDAVAVGVFSGIVFALGFSWLAARSTPFESFGDILMSTGILGGLIFGPAVGVVVAYQLQVRSAVYPVGSTAEFRARLTEVAPRLKLRIAAEEGTRMLVRPTRSAPLAGVLIKEDWAVIDLEPGQVRLTGGRALVKRIRRRLRLG